MSECYPTGCTPCTEPINFPDSPTDGQRYCTAIGAEGAQKCWVFDKCIPGWRAEGPSASPTRYRGAVDVKTQKPGYENTDLPVAAGDWYIQNTDATEPFQAEWGDDLGAAVSSGDRITFSGSSWQKIQPPVIPYAGEARDGDVPDPDDRQGGIVKNATVNQALAGTNKCDTITPYTLQQKINDELVDFSPTKPQTVTVEIQEGNDVKVCVNDDTLILTSDAVATTADGNPALGRFTYQWVETTSGTDDPIDGQTESTLRIEDYASNTSPSTLARKFKCAVTFIDLFSDSNPAESTETVVTLEQALKITGQPADADLSGGTQSATMTVTVEQEDAELSGITPTYTWYLDGVEISGAEVPAGTGYTFGNFTTNQLTITKKQNDEGGDYTIYCQISGGNCNGTGLVSTNAILNGPQGSGGAVPPPTPPPTTLNAVGTYTLVTYTGITNPYALGTTRTIPNKPGVWRNMGNAVVETRVPQPTGYTYYTYVLLYVRIS